jgi:hypothetical protein
MLSALAFIVTGFVLGIPPGLLLCRLRRRWCPSCGQTLRCPDCGSTQFVTLDVGRRPPGRRWSPRAAR